MNQAETAEDVEAVPADTDITAQVEDDDPDERAGDDVAYDLDIPSDPEGGA